MTKMTPTDISSTENQNVEVELRAEVSNEKAAEIESRLLEMSGNNLESDSRISAMWIGEVAGVGIDIRVRLSSSGHCEMVAKRGQHHASDRLEESLALRPDQFLKSVKTLSLLPLPMKLTKRENIRYLLPDDIEAALVRAGNITYLEVECVTSPDRVPEKQALLQKLCDSLGVTVIPDQATFQNLCDRLSRDVDCLIDPIKDQHEEVANKLNALLGENFTALL